MKNVLYVLTIVLACVSCNTEREYHPYTTAIRNTSDKPFYMLVLGERMNRDVDTLVNTIVKPNEIIFKNSYADWFFLGMRNNKHAINYMKLEFDNGKGYICDRSIPPLETCFQSKRSFTTITGKEYYTFENDVYYYDITQEDYENAHELP